MNIKQWTPVLVALVLAIGSVEAFADSGWHYDEGTDTIVFSFGSDTVVPSASSSRDDAMEQSGDWYYDEGSDTIVINSEGSRSQYTQASTSTNTFEFDYNLAFLDQ